MEDRLIFRPPGRATDDGHTAFFFDDDGRGLTIDPFTYTFAQASFGRRSHHHVCGACEHFAA